MKQIIKSLENFGLTFPDFSDRAEVLSNLGFEVRVEFFFHLLHENFKWKIVQK